VLRGEGIKDSERIAEQIGMSVEEVAFHINRWQTVSLDAERRDFGNDQYPTRVGDSVPSALGLPDRLFGDAEEMAGLSCAIARLIPTHRVVVEAVVGGESFQEIGLRLNITRQAIAQRYKKSIVALRKILTNPALLPR